MHVTASGLYDLVHCPQRVALDSHGDAGKRDPENPFVTLLWERGTLYEKEVIAKLTAPFTDLSALSGDEKERETRAAIQRGDALIYGGRICIDDLVGEPDLLRKEVGGYIPGDIKAGAGEEGGGDEHDGKPKLHYAVQLALYVDVLERLKLAAGRRAFIIDIHGEEVPYDFAAPQGPRKSETLWDEYQAALLEMQGILANTLKPQGASSATCKQCHWYTFCSEQLMAADDLTMIPFLGRSLRDTMQVTLPTIADLAAANPDGYINGKKTIFAKLGPDRLRLFQARAALLKSASPKPYLRQPVSLPVSSLELFFDIEVDPMRDHCYLHGIVERRDSNNDGERFVAFFADNLSAESERAAFAAAFAYLSGAGGIIYYYSKYERTIYRKLQAKYPDVCTAEDIERLFDPVRAIDLYFDVVFVATEWPTRDHSIKTLAKYLGFGWRDTHPSGAASIEWFDRWCRGDATMKQRILDYNEDDCRATRVLLDGIRAIAA